MTTRRSAEAQLGARLLGGQRQLATLDEVGDDADPVDGDDAAQPLDLDLGVDHDAVGRAAQPAQAPDVGLQVALAQALAVEDIVQGDHQRTLVGAAEAHQPRQRAAVLAPAAPVPLHQHDVAAGQLGGHARQLLGGLVDATGLDLGDGQVRSGSWPRRR